MQGSVFVDRDGKHFRHILNWLRDGVVPTLEECQYSELLREAEYYQLLEQPLALTNTAQLMRITLGEGELDLSFASMP
ncbi:unnamed protein product [Sphenostylis stenocarpa]|uniref:Potassium channel tetramerisation-type BTB domain-containing protein n=1 Tax=Sphenostylis stenocarpa TaxID=92480 RepID=A0AA86S9H4_9FABA|nr:unnamed protein product [Sphenostylis stenocarpa]